MSAQFTPGPWHAAMKFAKTWHVGVYDANGTEVAHVAVKSALHGARRKADARLMAASPDMFGEMKWLRDLLCEAHNQFDLVYVDMDGERINVMEAVERADAIEVGGGEFA